MSANSKESHIQEEIGQPNMSPMSKQIGQQFTNWPANKTACAYIHEDGVSQVNLQLCNLLCFL